MTAEPIEHEATVHSLEVVPAQAAAVSRCDVPRDLDQAMRLADAFCRSGILPKHLQGNPANVLAIMFAARALDIPLWQATQGLHSIDGKIGMSAEMMRALWLRAGHGFRVLEQTTEQATVEATRKGWDPSVVTFTMADAAAANLTSKGPWKSYPKAMLVARATSMALRQVGADVLAGFGYTAEELSNGGMVDDEWSATAAATVPPEVTELAAAIDAATDADTLRTLYVENKRLLALVHDGIELGQRIIDRQAQITTDEEIQDAELIEDVHLPEEPDSCEYCTGTGRKDDLFCGPCNGTGIVGGGR